MDNSIFNREDREEKKIIRDLLTNVKVIRDPVHGDIWINPIEKAIIDNQYFQRLRGIRQLGTTHLVYPGAVHTRFEHSLGTLYIARQIVRNVNRNYRANLSNKYIRKEEELMIRILALIHDAAHISFGHTLEDEGNVIDGCKNGNGSPKYQWLNEVRRKTLFSEFSEVIKKELSDLKEEEKIKRMLDEIEDCLIAEEAGEQEIHKLPRPFIADIVGNTICADLLDYLKRDARFTGLRMKYDPRILSYFILAEYEKDGLKKTRLTLKLDKREGQIRYDLIQSCIDILRMRNSLAQGVYHHRVKRMFSAVVIKMFYCAIKAGMVSENDLLDGSDDVVVDRIRNFDESELEVSGPKERQVKAAKRLAEKYRDRKIYEDVWSYLYRNEEERSKLEEFKNPEVRLRVEETLEAAFGGLPPGSVIIYPIQNVKSKTALVKVQRGNIVKTLYDMAEENEFDPSLKRELDSQKVSFNHLRKIHVFLDREQIEKEYREKKLYIKACRTAILDGKIPKEIPEYKLLQNSRSHPYMQILNSLDSTKYDPRDGSSFENMLDNLVKLAQFDFKKGSGQNMD
ncbi:MAG: HD domain-containing protein [Promethearchaeota archaeon]